MTWFAASLIIWSPTRPDDENGDGPCHFWERVVVIEADDVDAAMQEATDFGKDDAAANAGEAEALVFMGVRKIREIESLTPEAGEEPPGLVEVMFSEMEVKNKNDLLRLAAGNDVIVRYID